MGHVVQVVHLKKMEVGHLFSVTNTMLLFFYWQFENNERMVVPLTKSKQTTLPESPVCCLPLSQSPLPVRSASSQNWKL